MKYQDQCPFNNLFSVMQSEGNDDRRVQFKGDGCSGDLLPGEKIPEGVEEIQQKKGIVLLWPFSPWASGSFVNF